MRGLRVMGWAYAGSRQLMFRDQEVHTPAGVRGMKLRVPANPIYAETVEVWGATSTTVAWPEVYLALSQGVVDGIETAAGPSFDQKHDEFAKVLVRTDHVIYFHVWAVSARSWAAWSEAIRHAVAAAGYQAAMLNRSLRLENEKTIFRQFEDKGATVIVPDVDAFAESVTGVVQKRAREYSELLGRIAAFK